MWVEVDHDEAEMEGEWRGCRPITPNFLFPATGFCFRSLIRKRGCIVRVILVVIMENMEMPRTAKPTFYG